MGEAGATRVIVLGGGTAGWMAAAAIVSHLLTRTRVTLVESAEIGIVGVGEATLPHIRDFVTGVGIDERTFMAATDATIKLGIAFEGFGDVGERYVHPFGTFGRSLAGVGFHHFWLRHAANLVSRGVGGPSIGDWSLGVAMADAGRFVTPPQQDLSLAASYGYAYQFDATRLAPFLRRHSEARGVHRVEGRVADVERDGEGGDVVALKLTDGRRIEGDLFVDCSGFGSLLLGGALGEAWDDWSQWLQCDRAAALPCTSPDGPIDPFTRAVAMPAGWRWRIPLASRIGNGYVFCSSDLSEDAACDAILQAVEGRPLADPRILRFRAGRRRRGWVRNVVGVGLAAGFLEPLESTSIYLAQRAIEELIELFPPDRPTDADRAAFNTALDREYDRARDFLILHYHATRRDDTPFWNRMRTMPIPGALADRLALWRATAQVEVHGEGLFEEPSWIAVLLGQGVIPDGYDPRADLIEPAALDRAMRQLRDEVGALAMAAPLHDAWLAEHRR